MSDALCRHCGEALVMRTDGQQYYTHAHGLYRCQGQRGVSYGHNAAHPNVPCEAGGGNPCKCTYAPDLVSFSLCSMHQEPQVDCEACAAVTVVPRAEHEASEKLFRTDYAEWFRQRNFGREPDDGAWEIWRQITDGKKEP